MGLKKVVLFVFLAVFAGGLFSSCSNGDKDSSKIDSTSESGQKENLKEGEVLSYSNEDVSFGLFFDKEGVSRSLTLEKDQTNFKGYVIVKFPEEMGISAVQWMLDLPEGIEIVSDDYYEERNLALGRITKGLSEAFPCVHGPSILLHTITFEADTGLKDAVISILPDKHGNFLGIAECDGGKQVRAVSYKAVVNPED